VPALWQRNKKVEVQNALNRKDGKDGAGIFSRDKAQKAQKETAETKGNLTADDRYVVCQAVKKFWDFHSIKFCARKLVLAWSGG
jgi:hypothetical protein